MLSVVLPLHTCQALLMKARMHPEKVGALCCWSQARERPGALQAADASSSSIAVLTSRPAALSSVTEDLVSATRF